MADYPGLVYTHLADAMDGTGAATAALIRSFVRFDGTDPHPDKIKGGQPGDMAKILFDLDDLRDTGQMEPVTFKACDRIRRQIATFKAKIFLDNVKLLPMTAIVAAIHTDLESAIDPVAADGMDLGIDGCNAIIMGTTFRSRRTSRDEDASDRTRRVGILTIPVRITFHA